MGKRHAAAQAGIARAQAEEELREAETRRQSAEQERQLLTSYLGTEEQVAGTGRFNVDPNVLRFAQRYSVDQRALSDIAAAGSGVKNQIDPFQRQGGVELGQQYVSQANDLLGQAEAAARAGDFTRAEQLYAQAQQIISGVSGPAAAAFNLGGGEDTNAAIRASSAEGRIVGRQLLTARELGDPNSATSQSLRGRLLDPALAAVDENTRNAERAITAERSQIEGDIRQRSAGGGSGYSPRADLALKSQAASQAALQRAVTFSEAGQQKAALTAQVNLYFNEFAKRMAEDSVALAQDWVNGTAGVRDIYQDRLAQLDIIQADMANQWAQFFAVQAEKRRDEEKKAKAFKREAGFGLVSGLGAVVSLFGATPPPGSSAGAGAGGTISAGGGSGIGAAAAGNTFGSVGQPGGASTRVSENFAPGVGEAADVGGLLGGGGGGGAGFLGKIGSILSFL